MAAAAEVAAQLGWGTWRIEKVDSERRRVVVRASPFAAGFGPSAHPVCGAICGALQAMVSVGYGRDVQITETTCAAQSGGEECIFNAVLEPLGSDADGSQDRR
jgi:predicted hydrocarbon binding protein